MPSHGEFREEAARALPPPHEQEPASLRADIVDELADHLACAYRRELLRTQGDSAQSLKNVHARFGNPGAIARRLWFDAMKEKIMAQKLMVVGSCVSAILIAVVAAVGWRYLEANQRANAALVEKTLEANAALLARLEAMPPATAKAESLEWRSISLQFVDEQTGAPRRDLSVFVSGPAARLENSQQFTGLVPDKNGHIELAPVYYGTYYVTATALDGAFCAVAIHLRPGHDARETICVPTQAVGALNLQVAWPDELKHREAWCVIGAVQDSDRIIEGNLWRQQHPRFFAVHTDGRVVDLSEYFQRKDLPDPRFVAGELSYSTSDLSTTLEYISTHSVPQRQRGLSTLSPGQMAPFFCGLILQKELPRSPAVFLRQLWSIRFDHPDGHVTLLDTAGLDSIWRLFAADLGLLIPPHGANSATIRNIANPGSAVIAPGKTTPWRFTVPAELMAQIPADMLPPIPPVEARHPGQAATFGPSDSPPSDDFGSTPAYQDHASPSMGETTHG